MGSGASAGASVPEKIPATKEEALQQGFTEKQITAFQQEQEGGERAIQEAAKKKGERAAAKERVEQGALPSQEVEDEEPPAASDASSDEFSLKELAEMMDSLKTEMMPDGLPDGGPEPEWLTAAGGLASYLEAMEFSLFQQNAAMAPYRLALKCHRALSSIDCWECTEASGGGVELRHSKTKKSGADEITTKHLLTLNGVSTSPQDARTFQYSYSYRLRDTHDGERTEDYLDVTGTWSAVGGELHLSGGPAKIKECFFQRHYSDDDDVQKDLTCDRFDAVVKHVDKRLIARAVWTVEQADGGTGRLLARDVAGSVVVTSEGADEATAMAELREKAEAASAELFLPPALAAVVHEHAPAAPPASLPLAVGAA